MRFSWVHTADLHLKNNELWGNVDPKTGINFRLQDKLDNLSATIDFAIAKKVDWFGVLGDVFDGFSPDEVLRQRFHTTCVYPLLQAGIPIFVLIGNHDSRSAAFNLMSEANSIYKEKIGYYVISEPYVHEGIFHFVPSGFEHTYIPSIKEKDKQFLFAHFLLEGAVIGKQNFKVPGIINKALVRGFRHFQLGDVHKYQVFKSGNVNGLYVGSNSTIDFGEVGERKGFVYCIYDTDTDELRTKFIETQDRKFVELTLSESDYEEKITDFLNALDNEHSIVKVRINGSRDFIKGTYWNELKASLKKFTAVTRYEISAQQRPPIEQQDTVEDNTIISSLSTIEDTLKSYAKAAELSADELKVGMNILQEARSNAET